VIGADSCSVALGRPQALMPSQAILLLGPPPRPSDTMNPNKNALNVRRPVLRRARRREMAEDWRLRPRFGRTRPHRLLARAQARRIQRGIQRGDVPQMV